MAVVWQDKKNWCKKEEYNKYIKRKSCLRKGKSLLKCGESFTTHHDHHDDYDSTQLRRPDQLT